MRLQGRIALVTGASRGIGAAMARGFALEGARVGCLARSLDGVQEVAESIRSKGGNAVPVQANVTQADELRSALAVVAGNEGRLDVLIVNAGVNLDRNTLEDSDPEAWRETVHVNVIGAYESIRLAIPYLRESAAARVLTMGSGTGHFARGSNSSYASSKAALWALTRIAAAELREDGISVNELIPGPVRTALTNDAAHEASPMYAPDEWVKDPDDVVSLALYLVTCPAPGPSGQSFSLMRRTG